MGRCFTNSCRCMMHSLVFVLYMFLYIAPSSSQIALLVTYHEDINTVELILLVSSSTLIAVALFASMKLTSDLFHGETHYDRKWNCCFGTYFSLTCNNNALCFDITYVDGLRSGCFWLTFIMPWLICNIASAGVFAQQLIDGGFYWILIMTFIPVIIPLFGVPLGYIIAKTCSC